MISEGEGERRKKYVSVPLSFTFMCVLAIVFFFMLYYLNVAKVKAALRAFRRQERTPEKRERPLTVKNVLKALREDASCAHVCVRA